MEVWETPSYFILRMDRDEEVIDCLLRAAGERGLRGGVIHGLGALKEATLGWYDDGEKEYRKVTYSEPLEICHAVGSLSTFQETQPYIHLHASLGRSDFSMVGGHLFRGTISVTGEFYLFKVGGELLRTLHPVENVHLLSGIQEMP